MAHPRVLERDASVLLIIDVQEGYRGHTIDHERMVRSVRRLLDAANLMGVPVLATEQYPKGIGHTQREVADGFPADLRPIEKMSMSCCDSGCDGPTLRCRPCESLFSDTRNCPSGATVSPSAVVRWPTA